MFVYSLEARIARAVSNRRPCIVSNSAKIVSTNPSNPTATFHLNHAFLSSLDCFLSREVRIRYALERHVIPTH